MSIKDKVFDLPILFDVVRWCVLGSYKPMFSNLTKFVDHKDDETVLEIGCGTGIFSKLFKKNYTGVDFFDEFIVKAKREFPDKKFAVMDAMNMDFKDKSYDKVLLLNFLHHMDDDEFEKVMHECKRIATKGVFIMEPVPQKYNLVGRVLYSLDRGKHIRDFFLLKDMLNNYSKVKRYHMFRSLFYKLVLIECV